MQSAYSKRLLTSARSFEIANYTASCIIFGDFEFADDALNEAVWLLEMGNSIN